MLTVICPVVGQLPVSAFVLKRTDVVNWPPENSVAVPAAVTMSVVYVVLTSRLRSTTYLPGRRIQHAVPELAMMVWLISPKM